MSHSIGILFAFIALFSWGFGDFFIQKTTRVVGSWKALFFIGAVGLIGLFPFVYQDLHKLTALNIVLLGLTALIVLFAALFDFEALRQGKIAIIEPIISLELPITVAMGMSFANEKLSLFQIICMVIVFVGIILSITTKIHHLHYHRRLFEKGVWLAGIGAVGMALTNFSIGISSQEISPLVTIWFAHSFLAIICGLLIYLKGEWGTLTRDIRRHPWPILGESIFDNIAWIAYAFSMAIIPISIATTIGESYIVLAILLGLLVNREKIRSHQIIGIALSAVGVIVLSAI